MKRAGKLTAIAVALTASLTLAGPATVASAGAKAEAKQVLGLHNTERKDHNARALSMDAAIARYAKRHSRHMAKKGYLYHTSSLARVLDNRRWSIAGENVGVGGDLETIEEAFMASTPHRKNILRRSYDEAGIGVYKDDRGLYWVTVIFYG
jgi:uncharacterized protein YkwD